MQDNAETHCISVAETQCVFVVATQRVWRPHGTRTVSTEHMYGITKNAEINTVGHEGVRRGSPRADI